MVVRSLLFGAHIEQGGGIGPYLTGKAVNQLSVVIPDRALLDSRKIILPGVSISIVGKICPNILIGLHVFGLK